METQPQRGERDLPLESLSPRWGFRLFGSLLPGLTPWAIDCRPFGTKDFGMFPIDWPLPGNLGKPRGRRRLTVGCAML